MKFPILFIVAFFLFPGWSNAQSKSKIQKKFLTELNTILKNTNQHHWNYEGKMKIDSAFQINKKGVLSVTVSYKTDSTSTKVKMEAPFNKIKSVDYDLYLILFFEENDVTISETFKENPERNNQYQTNLFHIGIPREDGLLVKDQLQKMVDQFSE